MFLNRYKVKPAQTTTSRLGWSTLSLPKPISVKSFLYRTITRLTRPVVIPQMKKKHLKQPLQTFTERRNVSLIIYIFATLYWYIKIHFSQPPQP